MSAATGTDSTFSRFSLGRPTVMETSWKSEVTAASSGTTVTGMTRSLVSPDPLFSVGVPTDVMVPVVSTAPGRCRVALLPTTPSRWSASLILTSTTCAVEVTS